MRFSFLRLITPRPDTRPLYRRIFTNKRLDIAHKTFLRLIFGFILASSSFCVVNAGVYIKYIRPFNLEEKERLEKELIEADSAGFEVK
uniref:Small integral membrane protein 8 n=1 Tax=Strongyloides stercoralis TaxID=6248 RepID=A0A0K0E3J6_STRER